jgi:hypothetical protein
MPRGVPAAGFRMTKNRVGMLDSNGVLTENNAAESRFSIIDRFEFVSDMVRMLAQGIQASVIVTGPGGLGKSFTVMEALNTAGLMDITLVDDLPVGFSLNGGKTFRVIKGYSTAKGLYRTLYENREGVVVFDDCDSVLRDPVSLNLLKAALDSYDKRVISWRADIRDEDLPTSFLFNGRVVFISNQSSNSIDQAIITRSMAVDLSMTTAQKIERMRWLISKDDFMPEYEIDYKTDAIELIASLMNSVKELSLRTLIQVTKIRKAGGPRWRDLAEYTIAG